MRMNRIMYLWVRNFLIAEDNGINSDMLKELLKEEGAACDCAKNGMAAVDLFRHSKKGAV